MTLSPLNITNIPAARVPFIDERTGLLSREWYLFFLNLYTLVGQGSNAVSLDEVQIGPPPLNDVASSADTPGAPTDADVSALVSQFAEMAKELEALALDPPPPLSQITDLQSQIDGLKLTPPPAVPEGVRLYFLDSASLVAATPFLVTHGLNLQNQDSCVVSVKVANVEVAVTVETVDANSLNVTYASTDTATITVLGS